VDREHIPLVSAVHILLFTLHPHLGRCSRRGGENEILILARKFEVEISIVSCESLSVMHYGNSDGFTSRICKSL
jgi:hypothetical protein